MLDLEDVVHLKSALARFLDSCTAVVACLKKEEYRKLFSTRKIHSEKKKKNGKTFHSNC